MEPLRYEVDLHGRVQHLVHVRMTIPADVASGARLTVATWTPGSYLERDYVHHLQAIAATDADGVAVPLTPDGRTAWHLPDDVTGPVTVDLEWYARDLTVRTNHVDDHHALLVPPATFPYVDGATERRHEVTITPTAGHAVWGLLPTADGTKDGLVDQAVTFVADDLLHLIDSAFEVGDFRSTRFEVDGVPHRWVHASHAGSVDLERVAADVTAISEQAQMLFDDRLPVRSYTFLCVGGDAREGGGGLEHRDGAVLMLPALTDATEEGVDRTRSLIAHEYLHLWNVKRLVPADLLRMTHDRPTHTSLLWVAEGWTAYYDNLLPTRAGLIGARAYLDSLRDDLQWVLRTPGASRQSLADASWHAWTGLYVRDENSVNSGTSYYTHGAVVAACLDMLIRRQAPDGGGLDDAVRLLWQRFGHAHADGYPTTGYGHDDVVAAVSDAAGTDLRAFVDEHVLGTTAPPLASLLEVVGLELREEPPEANAPHLGVQRSEDDAGVLFDAVLRDGPAWRAGISGGDRLVAVDDVVVGRGEFERVLAGLRAGDLARLTVRRGVRLLTVEVELGDPLPALTIAAVAQPDEAQRTAFGHWTGHPLEDLSA